MTKTLCTAALTALLTTTISGKVIAQDTPGGTNTATRTEHNQRVHRPFRIELGAFFPSDKNTRNATGKTYSDFGLGYEFIQSTGTSSKLVYGVYLDERGNQRNQNGLKTTTVLSAFGISARIVTGDDSQSIHPYLLGGVGIYGSFAQVDGNGSKKDKTTTGIGGKLEVGIETNSTLMFGVGYDFVPDAKVTQNGTNYKFKASGAHVRVGFRF